MLPRCSTRLCSVCGISPSSVNSSVPATLRTVPAARQAGLAAVTSNPSDVADLSWSAVSTSRRFEPRVSRSPGRRRRAGSKGISGSGGSVGSPAAVSQVRAGATTWPSMFLWGRSLTLRSPGCSGPVRSFGPARSIAIRRGRPDDSAACLTWRAMAGHALASSCAQLMSAMFRPRCTRSLTSSGRSRPPRAASP